MIRKPTLDDVDKISEISVNGWKSAYSGLIPDDYLEKLSINKSKERFQDAVLNKSENIDVYEDVYVKAFAFHNRSRDEDLKEYYELTAIYVDPKLKNQGIGSKLIKYIENHAKKLGYTNLLIWVLEGNNKSINFYKKHGYKFDGKTKDIEMWNCRELRLSKEI